MCAAVQYIVIEVPSIAVASPECFLSQAVCFDDDDASLSGYPSYDYDVYDGSDYGLLRPFVQLSHIVGPAPAFVGLQPAVPVVLGGVEAGPAHDIDSESLQFTVSPEHVLDCRPDMPCKPVFSELTSILNEDLACTSEMDRTLCDNLDMLD